MKQLDQEDQDSEDELFSLDKILMYKVDKMFVEDEEGRCKWVDHPVSVYKMSELFIP